MSDDASRSSTEGTIQLENEVGFAVYATLLAFNKAYKPLLEPLKLTFPQYLVMRVLWERDDLTVNDLGDRLFLDSGTLTPLLKRLEATERVRRQRDTIDNRQVRITLTESGRSLKKISEAIPQQILQAVGLNAGRVELLKQELMLLRRALAAKNPPRN